MKGEAAFLKKTLTPKKLFLYLLIVSVSLSALIGIGIILFGSMGREEVRILLTTLTITCMSLLGLACGVCLENKRGKILPLGGIIFAVLAGILWIVIIWADRTEGEFFARLVMSVTVLTFALTHLSLISLARLDKRFKWAIPGMYISVIILVALLFGLIWDTRNFESDLTFRLLGGLSIAIAALTIVIPVFHKLSDALDETELIDREIEKLKIRISELEKRREKISNGD